MASRPSRGAGSLTRRLSHSQRRIHPACGTRPGRARAPAHARPACRTGTRNASARVRLTTPAQPFRPALRDARQARRTTRPSAHHGRAWRILEQPPTSPSWLLVGLLQELNDKPPLRVEVMLCCDETGKTRKSHRLVTHIHRVANPGRSLLEGERVFAERPLPPVQARHCCFARSVIFCSAVASSRRSADGCHRARRPAGPCQPPGHSRLAGRYSRNCSTVRRTRTGAAWCPRCNSPLTADDLISPAGLGRRAQRGRGGGVGPACVELEKRATVPMTPCAFRPVGVVLVPAAPPTQGVRRRGRRRSEARGLRRIAARAAHRRTTRARRAPGSRGR